MELAVLPLYRNHPIDLLCNTMGWFICNGNTEPELEKRMNG